MIPASFDYVKPTSVADAVDDIALGTAKGPMRFGPPFSRVIAAAAVGMPWAARNAASCRTDVE